VQGEDHVPAQAGLEDGAIAPDRVVAREGPAARGLEALVVATLGKFGGSVVAARLTGLGWRESSALGILMNTRGLMELVILNVGLEIGVISPALFAMMVLMALVTTVATSPILSVVLRAQPQLAPEGQEVRVRR
jgi:Kef-type K+ transport system membrane component KefB